MIESRASTYPQFQCPNCRAYWDLNADVDVEMDVDDDDADADSASGDVTMDLPAAITVTPAAGTEPQNAEAAATPSLLSRRQATNPGSPEIDSVNRGSIDVPPRNSSNGANVDGARTQTPDGERLIDGDGPLTPRNDIGPFVLDGSAGRASGRRMLVPALPEVLDRASATT
jgi:E3 ubiquitin-protein ligase DMA1/2